MRLLQFGDSMLPVGSFAFSNALESAVEQGVVHDVATLRGFVATATRQAATSDGVALLHAHRAAVAGDLEAVLGGGPRGVRAEAQRGSAHDDDAHGPQAGRGG